MRRYSFFILIYLLAGCTCNHAKKPIDELVPKVLEKYSINPVPNNLDTVGVIFALDEKGVPTTIGNLEIATIRDSVIVPYEVNASEYTLGMLLNFLQIRGVDSLHAGVSDTVKINTNFRVNHGVLSKFDPKQDLRQRFNRAADTIASNMAFLTLDTSRLFLVLETIRSNDVDLSNVSSSHHDVDVKAKIKKILDAHPHVNIKDSDSTGLTYHVGEPKVILYRLNKINANIVGARGNNPGRIELSLGEVEARAGLY
jgi:hypothetical protein